MDKYANEGLRRIYKGRVILVLGVPNLNTPSRDLLFRTNP